MRWNNCAQIIVIVMRRFLAATAAASSSCCSAVLCFATRKLETARAPNMGSFRTNPMAVCVLQNFCGLSRTACKQRNTGNILWKHCWLDKHAEFLCGENDNSLRRAIISSTLPPLLHPADERYFCF
ncbi:uncharacterized protein EI97DRAFT_133845 [Westerdykella ornata]|uniref:Secreted protein n=1 Tax=Westerdykella ornata TaxID=318751 RepID=A0A6A6JDQ4_WESOR|nr:uncharacterized protein EI97DRAFT_133845 [Westerdykella ornata]KAF2274303.1 hypothetical protein EI97DRAFT_133845 [Westerdykella ornata]